MCNTDSEWEAQETHLGDDLAGGGGRAAREGGESAYIQQIHCSLYLINYHNRAMQLYSNKKRMPPNVLQGDRVGKLLATLLM